MCPFKVRGCELRRAAEIARPLEDLDERSLVDRCRPSVDVSAGYVDQLISAARLLSHYG